jgi:hypothetical protein
MNRGDAKARRKERTISFETPRLGVSAVKIEIRKTDRKLAARHGFEP